MKFTKYVLFPNFLFSGIPSLVIAASSFDDVLAITGFSVVLGLIFSSGKDSTQLVNKFNLHSKYNKIYLKVLLGSVFI